MCNVCKTEVRKGKHGKQKQVLRKEVNQVTKYAKREVYHS